MYKCPIIYFQDNLVFNRDKTCWAAFKIGGFNYEHLSDEGKIEINWRLANYLTGVTSNAQLCIIPVEQDVDAHYDRLIASMDPEDSLYQRGRSYNEQTRDYLKRTIESGGEANDFETYIVVKLQMSADEIEIFKEGLAYFLKDPINAVNTWMALDTRDILKSKVEDYRVMAENWLAQQGEILRTVPATQRETQWLLRRGAYRGLPGNSVNIWYRDTDGEVPWQPEAEEGDKAIRPRKQIVNLFDGQIRPKNRYLQVETEEGISYQSFLVMSHFPDKINNPGREWIYQLQKRGVKPEICIHFEAIDPEKSLKKVGDKQQEIEGQTDHVLEAGARVPIDLKEGAQEGVWLESAIRDRRDPLLVTTVQFCVASQDLEDMQARANRLRSFFKGWQFAVERPVADQTKLFFNFIPSVSNMVRGYSMPLTPLAAASGIYGATHSIGDNKGAYIGTTAQGMKKVFLNLAFACLRDMSASASFLGNLGVGKSYNANLLVIIHILMGAAGLIIDPKGERAHWVDQLAILKGYINLISMEGSRENAGVLDPYNIYREDLGAATELAVNICLELCKIPYGSNAYIALKEAAVKVQTDGRSPCMHTLTLILDEWDETDDCYADAKRLARLIRAEKDVGMGQLIYGQGGEKTIHLNNRLNIIQIANMKLPPKEKKKADYTSEEIVSTVIMMVLGQFAKKFALQNNDKAIKRFQVILMDESWMLAKTEQGTDMYDFLVRMGRSLYTSTIFNGHSVLDVDESIRNGITYRFCFRTNDDAEAKRMLRYLGLEESKKNIGMMKTLKRGECMFRDADGRVDKLQFDAIYRDLHQVLNTTPKGKKPEEDELLTKEAL